MSTQVQHADTSSQQTGKKSNTIDRALVIQQREQLKQMVLQRFITDHSKGKERNKKIITDLVHDYFLSQKITDATLKILKQQVSDALALNGNDKRSMGKSVDKSQVVENHSVVSKVNHPAIVHADKVNNQSAIVKVSDSKKLQPLTNPPVNQQANTQQSFKDYDQYSMQSSKAPRSVYKMEGDEDDEWATLVKFDTELYKKEQELEKIRQGEFKRKIKNELDKQLEEKKFKKVEDVSDDQAYVQLAGYQRQVYDQREQDKFDNLKRKINTEKLQRDKQVRDEYSRKKIDVKREKELDDLLVRKIKEELDLEQQEQNQRRNKERERLLRMMKENEDYRRKALEDAKQERQAETQMQNQYMNLLTQLEEQREREKKEREDKMKKVMGNFADSVVKDQKNIIKQEDEKMLKNILDQNERERQEEQKKHVRSYDQKMHIRSFLNNQIEDKKKRQEEESDLNRRQAQIWKQDLENYNGHEKKKTDYIKDVNLRHAEILKSQMAEKQMRKKNKGYKMNTVELLQNKDRLKEISEQDPEIGQHVKKVEVMMDQ